jgi:hypothetical protein
MGGRLPKEPDEVRELWKLQLGLVEILVMGITIINLRCAVLPHGWEERNLPPLAYSDDSDGRSLDSDSRARDADDEESDLDL